jgi:hypothetical protein
MLILPVAEFFTTNHGSTNISSFLNDIRELVQLNVAYSPKKKIRLDEHFLPRIVVTDFSWALIDSVMKSLNNSDMNRYLIYCFAVLNPIDKSYADKKAVFGK